MRSGFDESKVRLGGPGPLLLIGCLRRRCASGSRLGAFRGPILALLVFSIASACPLLAEARKASGGGGSQIVRLTLKLDRATYLLQDKKPIKAELKFTNRSLDEPITIWSSGFWTNHKVLVEDEKGHGEVPLTDLGKHCLERFTPKGGDRDKNAPFVIQPGESLPEEMPVDLNKLYQLKPGKYKVQVLYEDQQPPTPFRLFSNAIFFSIE